ncbi:MAG: hypothetical protein K9K66_16935 [Desulfarculaceae bacterium]|nr:hypothetical protein [Desulfarculaceae bacterium]MCF8072583.1 hypothetical protein [Desulfarculaceae bacterium]MCF8103345.1 hypothetical protein [Desulfarculaceae bacterium]MCF8117496.1 hypothetical protein [Desulfarculaceae bacterium]
MTRATIIDDLLACLRAMGPIHGMPLAAATVLRGIHLAEQVNDLPALALFNERVESLESTDRTVERKLVLHLWGYAKAAGSDFSGLDRLAESALMALGDPGLNPHWERTACGNLEIYEGGAGDPLGIFDLELTVEYESPLNTL